MDTPVVTPKAEVVKTPYLPFFVYGTLLHGMWNYNTRVRGKTVDEQVAWVIGCCLQGTSIASLWKGDEEDEVVYGNLLWIDPKQFEDVLELLDALEGYYPEAPQNSSYNRIRIYANHRDESGEIIESMAYVYSGGNRRAYPGQKIVNGDYLTHMVRQGRR